MEARRASAERGPEAPQWRAQPGGGHPPRGAARSRPTGPKLHFPCVH